MSQHLDRRVLDDDVVLYGPDDAPISVHAQELLVGTHEGLVQHCRLIFSVDLPRCHRIEQQGLFNLSPDARGDLIGGGPFAESLPILVAAALRPETLLLAAPQARTAGAIWSRLASAEGERGALQSTESWYGLSVSQDTAAPPDSATDPPLIGYRTIWDEIGPPRAWPRAEEEPLSVVMTAWFKSRGWTFRRAADPLVMRSDFQGKNGAWECLAVGMEDLRISAVYSVFPVEAAPERRAAVAELCVRLSHGMPVGAYEMDWSNGQVRLKTSLDVENDRLSPALFNQLVFANLGEFDRWLPALGAVIADGMSPDEALGQLGRTETPA